MIDLTFDEQNLILAMIGLIEDLPVGSDALDGYQGMDMDEIGLSIETLKEKIVQSLE